MTTTTTVPGASDANAACEFSSSWTDEGCEGMWHTYDGEPLTAPTSTTAPAQPTATPVATVEPSRAAPTQLAYTGFTDTLTAAGLVLVVTGAALHKWARRTA